nr:MAG TPA: hypothetical protein [Caudoviricetes sp.]
MIDGQTKRFFFGAPNSSVTTCSITGSAGCSTGCAVMIRNTCGSLFRRAREPCGFGAGPRPATQITPTKTAEYQRSEPKLRHAFTGIACEIGG